MPQILGTVGLAMLVLWGTGCHKPAIHERPLPDPLLTSKKPIEGKPHVTESAPLARDTLPPPPPRPTQDRAFTSTAKDVPVVQLLPPSANR